MIEGTLKCVLGKQALDYVESQGLGDKIHDKDTPSPWILLKDLSDGLKKGTQD